ncbi:MAG: sigma-70 family RNA polymerase sigma factor [Chloroflexi bacterium]|nr:sigma-70 family RNA polymerase sigma factor [Chloroflexota bacterium]
MDTQSDEVLVEQAKADPQAFGALYERYLARIYSYCYYRTRNVSEAEDLTEKVFFQALSHLSSYAYRGLPFSVWLYRIAHNVVANWHRDRQRHRLLPLEETDSMTHDTDGLEQVEDIALVRRAVADLPPERQHLLLLKFVEGLSNAEIGRALGRSEGAIKALLHRTIRSLRDEITARKDGHHAGEA